MSRDLGVAGAAAIVALLVASSLGGFGPAPTTREPSHVATISSASSAPRLASASLAAARTSLAAGLGPAASLGSGCWAQVLLHARNAGTCTVGDLRATTPHPTGAGGWSLLGFPPYFLGGAVTWDAADGYVLEFGGLTVGNVTWTYLHGHWTNITSSAGPAPSTRLFPSLADDPALGAVVLFGGEYVGPGFSPGTIAPVLRDTWTFHGGHWANVTSSVGPAPAARWQAGLAYDADDSALVLYGGANATSVTQGGTWEFVNSTWKNVTANQTSAPLPWQLPAFAGDLSDGYAVWYGGGTASDPSGNETWEFSGNRWTNVTSNVTVSYRLQLPSLSGAMLTTDSSPGGVMLYGGIEAASGPSTYPTEYKGAWRYFAGGWNFVTGGGPAGAQAGLFADDPPDTGMVYYGGFDEFNVTLYADTYNFSGAIWHHVASPASPTPGVGPMMAYDNRTGSVLLFPGGDRNETWTYAGGTWTHQHPAQSPPVRVAGTLIDDPAAGGVLLFGGEYATDTFPAVHYRNDTWLWANGTWTNLTATAHGPPPRVDAAGAYDTTLGRAVLFGGLGLTRYENDTWEFSAGRWTNVTHGAAPSGRDAVAFSDDPSDHGLLAFGGTGSGCLTIPGYCNDTWRFDNGTWAKQNPGLAPPVQGQGGLAYDPAFGSEVLIGGTGEVQVGAGGHQEALNSTWLFAAGHWSNLTHSLGPRAPPPAAGPSVAYDAADGYLFLYDGGYNNIGLGDWWSLAPTTSTPLSVGTPTASVNPVVANSPTTLNVTVAGGSPPYTLSWSGLPPGCTSSNASTISCTPNAAVVTVVTVTASDALGDSVTGPGLSLTVTSSATGGGSLASVAVTPPSSTLTPNESVVLVAHPADASGHAIAGAVFVWSVVSGSVGAFNRTSAESVRFTAGSTAGESELRVVASYGGTTATGFANVTVSVASVPPAQGTTTSSSSFVYVEVGIAAAVVAVVAVVVGVLFLRRRGAPPAPP